MERTELNNDEESKVSNKNTNNINIKNTNHIITEYIKEQCHHQKIDNAIIILPENINIELLKTNDNIEIQHYREMSDSINKIKCLQIKVKNNNDNENIIENSNYNENHQQMNNIAENYIDKNQKIDKSIKEYCLLLNKIIDSNNEQWDWSNKIFLSSLSHQIKTPLTGILAGIEIIDTLNKNNSESQLVIKHLYQSCLELSTYIGEITAFYLLKQKKIKLEQSWNTMSKVINEVLEMFQCDFEKNNINIHVKYNFNRNKLLFKYDYPKVKQVFNKLLKNSIKFSNEGQINIYVQLSSNNDKLNISIMDTGIIIPDDEKVKIFKPFYQVNEQWMTTQEGLGLGLTICKEMINLMDGDIYVGNVNDSVFKTNMEFYLPIEIKEKKRSLPTIPTSNCNNYLSTNKKSLKYIKNIDNIDNINNVLIIEDNTINSKLIGLMVSKILPNLIDTDITQLNDSKLAFNTIINQDFDLILLDLKMPVVSGFDILEQLDNTNYFETHKTRFIIITALLQHDINDIIQKYNNIDILYKPIKLNQLKKIMLKRI